MTDIVARLREFNAAICREAADEIERLQQDVSVVCADICAENDNLKAENERLRAALRSGNAHRIAGAALP